MYVSESIVDAQLISKILISFPSSSEQLINLIFPSNYNVFHRRAYSVVFTSHVQNFISKKTNLSFGVIEEIKIVF